MILEVNNTDIGQVLGPHVDFVTSSAARWRPCRVREVLLGHQGQKCLEDMMKLHLIE